MEPTYTLTETQISILKLTTGGHSILEAGEIVCGHADTGRTHADHIRKRMNVDDIGGAGTLAMQLKIFGLHEVIVRLKDPSKPPVIPS